MLATADKDRVPDSHKIIERVGDSRLQIYLYRIPQIGISVSLNERLLMAIGAPSRTGETNNRDYEFGRRLSSWTSHADWSSWNAS